MPWCSFWGANSCGRNALLSLDNLVRTQSDIVSPNVVVRGVAPNYVVVYTHIQSDRLTSLTAARAKFN